MTVTSSPLIHRSEQQEKDTWDLTPLYSSIHAWEEALQPFETMNWEEITKPFVSKDTLSSSDVFLLFETFFRYERELKKLYTYAHLLHDQDTSYDEAKKAYKRVTSQYSRMMEAFSWIEPKILSHSEDHLQSLLSSEELRPYTILLERIIRQRPHTLDETAEALIAMAQRATTTGGKAFRALSDADFRFDPALDSEGVSHEVTHASYGMLLRSHDRTLRKNAFLSMSRRFSQHENGLTELLSGQVEQHRFIARARKYSSCLEASLFPKGIPVDVYRSLISAVREHLPLLHQYMKLRKKLLKVDSLHMWDLYVPLIDDIEITMTYDEAVSAVIEAVAPLGEEYCSTLQLGLSSQRWVDRYENASKRSGAYSSGCYDSYPYILMNYKNILRDVFTLAHEAGHSMHSHLSKRHQPYHYAEYEIFVAEVASTFNEALLSKTLIKKAKTDRERAYIINEKLEDIRATLFRQTMFAEFELFIHETIEKDKPLTPALLQEYYLQLNRDYFGEDVSVDPEIAIEWARIPHFYYNFYVYQYATGISAALALADRVLNGTEKERDEYLSFLQGGSSLFPIELLKKAGIDISTPAPIVSAMKTFGSLLDEFRSLALERS